MENLPKPVKWMLRAVEVFVIGMGILFIGYALNHMQGADFVPKTLWDWLDLLIVPAVLAIGGVILNATIRKSEQERTEEQARIERERAEQQAEIERTRIEEQQREQALQNYLKEMNTLMIDKGLLKSEEGAEVRNVARAITLTVLRNLDPSRKSIVIKFLAEAGLINVSPRENPDEIKQPVISLSEADIEDADLSNINLVGANLRMANLKNTKLLFVEMKKANLGGADLKGADLTGADLSNAKLDITKLIGSTLVGTRFVEARLRDTFFTGADLTSADFSDAVFQNTDLSGANLMGAKITKEQLRRAMISSNTKMPDGSNYKPPQQP